MYPSHTFVSTCCFFLCCWFSLSFFVFYVSLRPLSWFRLFFIYVKHMMFDSSFRWLAVSSSSFYLLVIIHIICIVFLSFLPGQSISRHPPATLPKPMATSWKAGDKVLLLEQNQWVRVAQCLLSLRSTLQGTRTHLPPFPGSSENQRLKSAQKGGMGYVPRKGRDLTIDSESLVWMLVLLDIACTVFRFLGCTIYCILVVFFGVFSCCDSYWNDIPGSGKLRE